MLSVFPLLFLPLSKRMEHLAAISAKEAKSAASEERKEHFSAEGQFELA